MPVSSALTNNPVIEFDENAMQRLMEENNHNVASEDTSTMDLLGEDDAFNASLDNLIHETQTMDTRNPGKRAIEEAEAESESQGLLNFDGANAFLQQGN